uniref:Aryl hydrocarbon receptor interacting protein like 2 n=1 Tax=Astyanax mexicanus TaxID=7994 RepID=A0A3B1J1B2_ASTMX
MEKDEKMQVVPALHLQGNQLVRQGRYREASEKYKEAVLLLRVVQSREMPGDEDYIHLGKLIIPLVLNYCQCMLELEEYYEVIQHASELIDKHKDCVKAYYKRAKAYAAVWSEREAKKDFLMVSSLDVTLARLVHRELQQLSERMKEKYWEDKERYWNMLEEKKSGEKEEEEEEKQEAEGPTEREEEPGENLSENTQVSPQQEDGEETTCEEKSPAAAEEEPKTTEEEPRAEEPRTEVEERMAALIEGKDRQQMLRMIMLLQDEGSFHIKERNFEVAMTKFKEALDYVDYIQTKEVEYKGEDWESLEKVRLPLTLNLSQCRLELGEHQEVIHLNSKLLKNHKDNLKAFYQRARAHSALCNEEEARRDFDKVVRLDPKFKPIVQHELKRLGKTLRTKHAREKKNYWASSQEKWEKKALVKRQSKVEKKKEVKWADESKTAGESSAVLVKDICGRAEFAETSETTNSGKAEETSSNLPNDEEESDKKTKCFNTENTNLQGMGEADVNKPVDEDRHSDQPKDGRDADLNDTVQKSPTDTVCDEVNEDFQTLAQADEEADKNSNTSQAKSTNDVKEESIKPTGTKKPGSSGGAKGAAPLTAGLAQPINRPGSAGTKKCKTTIVSQKTQGKSTSVKTPSKEASATSSATSRAPAAKSTTAKNVKRKPK